MAGSDSTVGLSRELGIDRHTVAARLRDGWSTRRIRAFYAKHARVTGAALRHGSERKAAGLIAATGLTCKELAHSLRTAGTVEGLEERRRGFGMNRDEFCLVLRYLGAHA